MAEDLAKSLDTYQVQLEQVEAALIGDPSSSELLKLKSDLEEVISLTKNLLEAQRASSRSEETRRSTADPVPIRQWKVGDTCQAVWSEDGKWYNCVIDAITDDGMVAVTFDGYNNSDVTKLSQLRERSIDGKKLMKPGQAENDRVRKRMIEQQRLAAKKKKQKKFERQKMIEEAHEMDKAKWQAFTAKTKKLKGVIKKSIFATPDTANGRVGIGTCGIGGKPMTEYAQAEKWRKGT